MLNCQVAAGFIYKVCCGRRQLKWSSIFARISSNNAHQQTLL